MKNVSKHNRLNMQQKVVVIRFVMAHKIQRTMARSIQSLREHKRSNAMAHETEHEMEHMKSCSVHMHCWPLLRKCRRQDWSYPGKLSHCQIQACNNVAS